MLGSQYNPLRLPKSREEYEANLADPTRQDLGVTGSLYAGEEATVVISIGGVWHHMDVEYAELIRKMLAESISFGAKHNNELKK